MLWMHLICYLFVRWFIMAHRTPAYIAKWVWNWIFRWRKILKKYTRAIVGLEMGHEPSPIGCALRTNLKRNNKINWKFSFDWKSKKIQNYPTNCLCRCCCSVAVWSMANWIFINLFKSQQNEWIIYSILATHAEWNEMISNHGRCHWWWIDEWKSIT